MSAIASLALKNKKAPVASLLREPLEEPIYDC